MTAQPSQIPSYNLATVNNAPERAKRIIGRVAEAVKDQYNIQHVYNIESPDPAKVKEIIKEYNVDILFTASMWTPEESYLVRKTAVETKPEIKTYALPQGLQVAHGPDAVFELIVKNLPGIIDGNLGNFKPSSEESK